MQELPVIKLILQYADNALILGHRLSEWCGHGPILEQDIAITNMSLDHIGQCRYLFDRVAAGINELPPEARPGLFKSVMLKGKLDTGEHIHQDQLAYLRDSWEFRNFLLVEQPNGNWADTIVRSFFYDTYMCLLYNRLKDSQDDELSAIAEKSLKEAEYHFKWSSDWMIRLGDGTEESHEKMKEAIDDLWPYTGEMFLLADYEKEAYDTLGVASPDTYREEWLETVTKVFADAQLPLPAPDTWMHQGGKTGVHSEHLGYILTEMQFMQRAYPDMEW